MKTWEYAVTAFFGMLGIALLFVFAAYIFVQLRDWWLSHKSREREEDSSNHGASALK
jgi:hypothetical protein